MKKRLFIALLYLTLPLSGWGFKAHKIINQKALDTLPKELQPWFGPQAAYFIEHSIYPDERRSSDRSEGNKHYLNLEYYETTKLAPMTLDQAKAAIGSEQVERAGIVPWRINEYYGLLVEAFKNKNSQDVVRIASELGHYVGDAHVPLHGTKNHDGQLTGQKGFHSAWESRLVEKYVSDQDLSSRSATLFTKPLDQSFEWISESYALSSKVLESDRLASLVNRSESGFPRESEGYWITLWAREKDNVRTRMTQSSDRLGSLIYTAWVEAGKPNAPGIP